ncbi:Uncharacterized protein PODLI_1B017128, partial [Podarcis lilfordi]
WTCVFYVLLTGSKEFADFSLKNKFSAIYGLFMIQDFVGKATCCSYPSNCIEMIIME